MLTDATEAFEDHDYPMTTEELVEASGDITLKLPNGEENLGDALERSGPETFESAEEAKLTAAAGLSSKAIGRKGYSDRDPIAMGEEGPDEVSF
jgi:hypothetical protein